jgi:hypothetical protein
MTKVEEEGLQNFACRGKVNAAGRAPKEVWVKGRAWREGDRVEVDWWQRFKDDCLGLFCGTREEFELFFTTMNNVDKDINFTCEVDLNKNKVVYLTSSSGLMRTASCRPTCTPSPTARLLSFFPPVPTSLLSPGPPSTASYSVSTATVAQTKQQKNATKNAI